MPRLTVFRPSRIIILRYLCNAKPQDREPLRDLGLIEEGRHRCNGTSARTSSSPPRRRRPARREEAARPRADQSRARSAYRAGLAEIAGRPDRDQEGGRSGPRGHRPAEAHGWRLPGDVPQRERQAEPPRHHQPVRRHERHQQDVRLEERCRARAQARGGAAQAAQAGGDFAGRGAGAGARRAQAEGREQVPGADPAHDLRAGIDRRLRHPLRHRSRNSMAAPTSATTA